MPLQHTPALQQRSTYVRKIETTKRLLSSLGNEIKSNFNHRIKNNESRPVFLYFWIQEHWQIKLLKDGIYWGRLIKETVEGLYSFITAFLLVEHWLNIIFMFVSGKAIHAIIMNGCMKAHVYCTTKLPMCENFQCWFLLRYKV